MSLSRLTVVALLSPILIFQSSKIVAEESTNVDRVKAAFTLNIAKFVSWPLIRKEENIQTLSICIFRNKDLIPPFNTVVGKKVGKRKVGAIRVVDQIPEQEICDVLYIPSGEISGFMESDADINQSALTIADATQDKTTGTIRRGIVVALVRKKSSMGLEINLNEASKKEIKLSAELLKLASIVGGGS